MVSISGRLLRAFLRRFQNINATKNPNVIQKIKSYNEDPPKINEKRGYKLTFNETPNKSKYLSLKKESIEPKHIIFYVHGGAYILNLTKLYEKIAYFFCDLSDDIEVILPNYSQAPEFKYPTQLNEVVDIWHEVTKRIDPDNIIVGGDSAGGNASLSLIQKIKNEGSKLPKGGIFISPWTDMTCSGESYIKNYQIDPILGDENGQLTKEDIIKDADIGTFCFIGDADRKDPYLSPIFGDYSTFPKSLFIVGSDEMLLDDTLAIVNKLKENNNDVELDCKEGMFHIFPIYSNMIPESRDSYNKMKKFVQETFYNNKENDA